MSEDNTLKHSEEEIIETIEKNETFANATAFVKRIDIDKGFADVEFNFYLWSPKLDGETLEVLDSKALKRRKGIVLRVPLSKLFVLPMESEMGETPRIEVEYAMKRSEAFEDAKEIVLDLYTQACLIHPNSSDDPIREFQYDNQCMSAYEYAEEKLIEWGEIKPEQCVRRRKDAHEEKAESVASAPAAAAQEKEAGYSKGPATATVVRSEHR